MWINLFLLATLTLWGYPLFGRRRAQPPRPPRPRPPPRRCAPRRPRPPHGPALRDVPLRFAILEKQPAARPGPPWNSSEQSEPKKLRGLVLHHPPLRRAVRHVQSDVRPPLLPPRPIRRAAPSEPLWINLFLLATLTLWGYPLWSELVTGDVPTFLTSAGSIAAGAGSAALSCREGGRRAWQLNHMEKELNAERLQIRLPANRALSSARTAATLKELILAIRGSKDQLKGSTWDELCALRRRLEQSQTLVVTVPADGLKQEDWGWDDNTMGGALWLAKPLHINGNGGCIEYFADLLEGYNDMMGSDSSAGKGEELAWFALNFKGRSVASGLGDPPNFLELLGRHGQPVDLLDESDEAEAADDAPTTKAVLAAQANFYDVLAGDGDASDMAPIFASNPAREVDEVLDAGGRIDGWDACLEPSARPAGMTISGSDVWMASPDASVAYSTCVEFPPNAGMDGATLLALQRWRRDDAAEGAGEWKLELHRTI
ncbi:hypothetical protein ACHAWF_001336, partial [Thalassiosira exigua]